MEADKVATTVGEGLRGLLLEPVYFISEIYSAVLPGLIFAFLLFEKHNGVALLLFKNQFFGYKTKLAVCLLLSYAMGKVLELPFAFLRGASSSSPVEVANLNPKQEKAFRRVLFPFFAGFVFSALMAERHNVSYLGRFVLSQYNAAFYCVTGTALVVASAIPGDGDLRLWELGLGAVLVTAGTLESKRALNSFMMLLGSAAADWVTARASLAQIVAVAKILQERMPSALQADRAVALAGALLMAIKKSASENASKGESGGSGAHEQSEQGTKDGAQLPAKEILAH